MLALVYSGKGRISLEGTVITTLETVSPDLEVSAGAT